MSDPTHSPEYHAAPVSSLRSKFEQLAAQSSTSVAPSPSSSSGRGRPLVQYGGPATSSSQSLGVSEFGEGMPRVRARSNPSAPPPIPGPKPNVENGEAVGNGTALAGVIAPTPRKPSEVRASPSSPDLGAAYRKEGYLEAGGHGASSEGSTPADTRPPRPISRRDARTPTASPGPLSRSNTPAPSPPSARTPAPAPPPPRARTPVPPTASPVQSPPVASPPIVSASTSAVPTVVIDPAALARKPPPPPPTRPRTSGEGAPQVQFQVHTPDTPSKYIGLAPRSPSNRSLSPVTRSSSAPSFTAPRPVPIPNGGPHNDEAVPEHQGQYTESPPPLPARPGGPPLVDELGRRPGSSAPSPSATLPLRHRPTVSTSAVPSRGAPPSVPPRPTTGSRVSPVSREIVLSPEAPPLPSRPRISPVSSDDTTATLLTLSGSSSGASYSSSLPATASQGTAPPLPVRKIAAPLPLSNVFLPPELSPGLPKISRSAPPIHPAIEKRQASLESSTSPPAPNPMPAYPAPPSRSLDTQPTAIPSSPLPPRLPPPTRTVTMAARPSKREKSGDDESDSDDDYENGDTISPPGATSMLPVPSPTPSSGNRRGVEDLPEATHSNRRPPHMFVDQRSFPATSHLNQYPIVAVAGSFVVVAAWTVRVYDVEKSGQEAMLALNVSLDDTGLEWRVKEPRVTAMEFRPGAIREEEGRYLWLGTKDGHLWELDLWTGIITETRAQAHSSAVIHIFRHQRSMVTIEESGKMLVFDSDGANGVNAPQLNLMPRFIRIGEKQAFAKVLGKQGQVWTSEGSGPGGTVGGAKSLSNTPTKGPAIRVYDIRSRENGGGGYRTLVCPEPLGAVTAGCILPSQPDVIYLGHEGGYLSVWSRTDEDPKFIKSVKIGPSDILALEGVMNSLWIGNRQGVIAAYDVSPWPWRVANMWKAHGDSPVTRLLVDVIGIERNQRLTVLSMGKDEKVRLWDGLLMYHWINDELLKREEQFATFRPINVLLCTWNVDAAKPEMLTGTAENATFFENVLHSVDAPDIIVFSFQELIDLENRKLTAKTVLLGSSKRTDGGLTDKVSRHYRLWYDKLVSAVRIAMPPDQPYVPILTENLVGLFTCVFVRASEKPDFKDVHITTVKRGMGGIYGNKGAIVARFAVDDSSLCFINCHLAAGQRHVRERNSDVAAVMEDKTLLPESEIEDDDNLAYGGGGDGTMALDHEICFLNGDLNYRIDQRRDAVIANIQKDNYIDLLPYDQLQKELSTNPAFRLRGFSEAPITFKPTYKYDKRSDDYDSSGKQRTPAWCDRILFRCRDPKRIQPLAYKRLEPNISDHRPVVGVFRVTVKSLTHELRHQVKQQLLEEWKVQESENLGRALAAYQQQGLLPSAQQPH